MLSKLGKMYTKNSTQCHFSGMAGYSVGMPNIYLPEHMFRLMFAFGVCEVCCKQNCQVKPKD